MGDVRYIVTGRYMDGTSLVGYHVQGSDGSNQRVNKNQAVYMVYNGLIMNLRVQPGIDGKPTIRGKGINLNTLPVMNLRNSTIRSGGSVNSASEQPIKSTKTVSYTIEKRMIHRGVCIGYILRNSEGAIRKKSVNDTKHLALQRVIENAVVKKWVRDNNTTELILKGVNCDLSRLPEVYVDDKGNILESNYSDNATYRMALMNKGGVLKNAKNGSSKPFKAGCYLMFNLKGEIDVVNAEIVKEHFAVVSGATSATCDMIAKEIEKYTVDIFGGNTIQLTENTLSRWGIAKRK